MADTSTKPDKPAAEAEHTPTEDGLSGVSPLGKTGALLAHIGGKRYLLREPKFGQLKRLRVSRQQADDAIEEVNTKLAACYDDIKALADELAPIAEDDLTATQKRRRDQLIARTRKTRDELTDFADDRRLAWWREVFQTLSADGVPDDDDWPGWVVDKDLPVKVVAHWRQVPLGPG